MVIVETLRTEKYQRKDYKYCNGYNLLNHLQLYKRERASQLLESNPVCRYHKPVLNKGYSPTDEHNTRQSPGGQQCVCLKLQLTVPGQRHKSVGNHQQQNCKQRPAHTP